MSDTSKVILLITICFCVTIGIGYWAYLKPQNPNTLQQEQINLDSIKAYTTHKYDSVANVNKEFEAKIVAKEYIILTLKGLVNDNNKKYQVITDSTLVVELERLRGIGIR
jgi:hypothetical protein